MVNHLLVPVDGSELSGGALQAAIELAQKLKARLTVFYALPTAGAYAYARCLISWRAQSWRRRPLGFPR
jgi:nucleotide-binding universal stress UspA family protein